MYFAVTGERPKLMGFNFERKDFSRFLDTARGSVFECIAILQMSERHTYVAFGRCDELRGRLINISEMLSGLKRSFAPGTTNNERQAMNGGPERVMK